jgi:curved DNA-binding protein CbpA
MEWKCPECGNSNDAAVKECACGYAFYKILGVKPDASEEEVKQAYKYLLKVWQTDRFLSDPLSEKKAKERLKKINDAFDTFRQHTSDISGDRKRSKSVKMASFAALFVLVLAGLLVFFSTSQKDKPQEQSAVQPGEKVETVIPAKQASRNLPEVTENQSTERLSEGEGASQKMLPQERTDGLSAGLSPEKAEERAIETVKKSHVIDRFSDVEALMKKWTDENSGKFQIIGWRAKKADEGIYLVSYTASDGLETKGFYFDIDMNTGTVHHIADHPELQKKYGIKYKQ